MRATALLAIVTALSGCYAFRQSPILQLESYRYAVLEMPGQDADALKDGFSTLQDAGFEPIASDDPRLEDPAFNRQVAICWGKCGARVDRDEALVQFRDYRTNELIAQVERPGFERSVAYIIRETHYAGYQDGAYRARMRQQGEKP